MAKACLLIVCVLTFTVLSFAQSSRKSVSGSEVTGTFSHAFTGKYRGSSSAIKLQALGHGKLRIALDLIYPYTMPNGDLMANTGELDGEAAIDGDTATYTSEDGRCTITFKFVRPGAIKVSQEGSDATCGFGNRVTADGTYKKVSAKKPNFDRDH